MEVISFFPVSTSLLWPFATRYRNLLPTRQLMLICYCVGYVGGDANYTGQFVTLEILEEFIATHVKALKKETEIQVSAPSATLLLRDAVLLSSWKSTKSNWNS